MNMNNLNSTPPSNEYPPTPTTLVHPAVCAGCPDQIKHKKYEEGRAGISCYHWSEWFSMCDPSGCQWSFVITIFLYFQLGVSLFSERCTQLRCPSISSVTVCPAYQRLLSRVPNGVLTRVHPAIYSMENTKFINSEGGGGVVSGATC